MIWKDIYGKYEVSDSGFVRNGQTGKILSQSFQNEYKRVGLLFENKTHIHYVHSLVALGFFGERPVDNRGRSFVVNHKDGNKLNNNVGNLEYISTWDNTRHYHTYLKNRSNE
jgi:hypothetical protein